MNAIERLGRSRWESWREDHIEKVRVKKRKPCSQEGRRPIYFMEERNVCKQYLEPCCVPPLPPPFCCGESGEVI
jgi:hypothetical protein